MFTRMKGNGTQKVLRLLGIAGVALFGLTVPALCGSFAISDANHSHSDPATAPSNATKSETGEMFEEFIHFQENGERFLYASTPPEGSGAFRTEAMFWIAPDGTLQQIGFEHAGRAYEDNVGEGETVRTGGPGILFSDGRLGFEFDIGNKGDSLCCPTAGRIHGTYKVVGEEHFDPKSKEYSCTFKLVIDKYKREILPSADEASRFNSKN